MAQPDDMLNDDDYPAYTMGRAAEIVGASQDFLRRLDEAKLITPFRSAGGHRRYSRYQLRSSCSIDAGGSSSDPQARRVRPLSRCRGPTSRG